MGQDPRSDTQRALTSVKGCLFAAHGAYLLVAGLALAVLSWLLPGWLAKIAHSEVVDGAALPPLVRWVVDHPATMPWLALPAIGCGVVMMFRVPWRWLWLIAGSIALVVPAAVLIYSFVACMAGLYDPAPL